METINEGRKNRVGKDLEIRSEEKQIKELGICSTPGKGRPRDTYSSCLQIAGGVAW